MLTGDIQLELAGLVAQYAKVLSNGEMRHAIRLGAPSVLEGECILCDTPLKPYCPNCQTTPRKKL